MMLYWFFVKVLGPLARHRFSPRAFGVDNIPRRGGGIIAANHLSVIDDGVIPLTSPRMVHYMGKSDYFTGKGIKGAFKKWWFTSVGVFPVDRAGGAAAEGAMNTARDIIEQGICSVSIPRALEARMGDYIRRIQVLHAWRWKPDAPLYLQGFSAQTKL